MLNARKERRRAVKSQIAHLRAKQEILVKLNMNPYLKL